MSGATRSKAEDMGKSIRLQSPLRSIPLTPLPLQNRFLRLDYRRPSELLRKRRWPAHPSNPHQPGRRLQRRKDRRRLQTESDRNGCLHQHRSREVRDLVQHHTGHDPPSRSLRSSLHQRQEEHPLRKSRGRRKVPKRRLVMASNLVSPSYTFFVMCRCSRMPIPLNS